jgi:S1-C subfamily serine protease
MCLVACLRSVVDGAWGATAGTVKLLLPPRQSRGISLVISLRVKYRAAAGGMGDGAPLDQFADPRTRSIPEGQPRVRTSQGSGFFISPDGYAVTNRHVTAGSESVELITGDQKSYRAKVVAVDPATDIALLKVDSGNGFAHVEFSDRPPRVGDRIFAVGNPFGLGDTASRLTRRSTPAIPAGRRSTSKAASSASIPSSSRQPGDRSVSVLPFRRRSRRRLLRSSWKPDR